MDSPKKYCNRATTNTNLYLSQYCRENPNDIVFKKVVPSNFKKYRVHYKHFLSQN